MKEFTITGILYNGNGGFQHTYLDNEYEDGIENFFVATIGNNGGFDRCKEVEFEFRFPIIAVSNETTPVHPYKPTESPDTFQSSPTVQSRNNLFQSPEQGVNITVLI